jgi:hypothetical protein
MRDRRWACTGKYIRCTIGMCVVAVSDGTGLYMSTTRAAFTSASPKRCVCSKSISIEQRREGGCGCQVSPTCGLPSGRPLGGELRVAELDTLTYQ